MTALAPWIAHYTGQAGPVRGGLYVSDAELEQLDGRVMGEALAVDAAVSQCSGLSPADQLLWQQKFASWQAEHLTVQAALASSVLGLGDAAMASALTRLETDILAMQDRVHAACPKVIAGTKGTSMDWGSVVVIAAVAASVAVGLWALSPVLVASLAARRGR